VGVRDVQDETRSPARDLPSSPGATRDFALDAEGRFGLPNSPQLFVSVEVGAPSSLRLRGATPRDGRRIADEVDMSPLAHADAHTRRVGGRWPSDYGASH